MMLVHEWCCNNCCKATVRFARTRLPIPLCSGRKAIKGKVTICTFIITLLRFCAFLDTQKHATASQHTWRGTFSFLHLYLSLIFSLSVSVRWVLYCCENKFFFPLHFSFVSQKVSLISIKFFLPFSFLVLGFSPISFFPSFLFLCRAASVVCRLWRWCVCDRNSVT